MGFIKDRRRVTDTWQLLRDLVVGEDGTLPPIPLGNVIVPLSAWRRARAQLLTREGRIGVWLRGDDEPGDIAEDLVHLDVIAVEFTSFTDGRGYSTGRLLRQRYGWRGELRAIGDVQRDQLFYLARCGFDAFSLREGEDVDAALTAFEDFSERYQAAVDQPVPLFRRREPATCRTSAFDTREGKEVTEENLGFALLRRAASSEPEASAAPRGIQP
jgi:uncharacterized protein (DUF934 family)